jgi:adenine-specific DNA-methyltransferase
LFASSEDVKKQRKEMAEIEKKLKQAIIELEYLRQNPLFRKGLEWRMEFPEILDNEGNFVGFDVIIANPPYIYSQNGFFSDSEKQYFEKEYPLIKYQVNSFGLFLELGLKLLSPNGYVSMIIPNTFLTVNQYETMRRFILEKTGEVFILNSQDKIFEDASVDNCIINAKSSSPTLVQLAELKDGEVSLINEVSPIELLKYNVINLSAFKEGNNPNMVSSIIKTIEDNSKPLEPNYAIVRDGLKVYQKGKGEPKQTRDDEEFNKLKADREWFSDHKEDDNYWEIIKGEHIDRYKISRGTEYILYGRHLAEPRTPEMFMGERLLIRQIPRKTAYSLTVMFTDKPIMHGRSLIAIRNLKLEPYFTLGVLNSKVESFFAIHKYDFLQRKTFPQLRLYQIKELPIPNANEDEKKHLIELVEKQLLLHDSSEVTKEIKEQMNQLNSEIDEYVMLLFKLNEEEKQAIRDFNLDWYQINRIKLTKTL